MKLRNKKKNIINADFNPLYYLTDENEKKHHRFKSGILMNGL